MSLFFSKASEILPCTSKLKIIQYISSPYYHSVHSHKMLFASTSILEAVCSACKHCFHGGSTPVHLLIFFILVMGTLRKWAAMVASFRCTGMGCRFAVGKCVIISCSEFLNVRHWSVVFFFLYIHWRWSMKSMLCWWLKKILLSCSELKKKGLCYMKDILTFPFLLLLL